MTDTIKLESGLKRIAIERDGQHVGEISFDPKDALFAERFYDLYRFFGHKKDEYEQKAHEFEQRKDELDEFGAPLIAHEQIILLRETCMEFIAKIDLLFGPGTGKILFGDVLDIELIGRFFEQLVPYFETARAEKMKPYTYTRSGKKIKP